MWTMSSPLPPVSYARGLPYAAWCPAVQGAGTPCLAHGRACVGHGGGGAVAPAPFLGSHQKIRPHTPEALLWGAAGISRGSIWCVILIAVAPSVVLPILIDRLAYEVCFAGWNGGIR